MFQVSIGFLFSIYPERELAMTMVEKNIYLFGKII